MTEPGNYPANPPAEQRFANPADAWSAAHHLIRASRERVRKYAIIQGMFDGNPPYDPVKLRNTGQAHRANFNSGEAKGLLQSALTPYYDLFSSTAHYADVVFEGDNQLTEAATVVFDRMLKDWDSFNIRIEAMLKDFLGFSRGYLYFPDPKDWRFEFVHHHKVIVPDATPKDPSKLEWFLVRDTMLVHELWDKIKGPKVGWNREAGMKSIEWASPCDSTRSEDWAQYQQELNSSELLASAKSRTIHVIHLFVREFNGTWTHLVMDENIQPDAGTTYLYQRERAATNVRQLLCPFFFEIQDGMWNEDGGLGKMLYNVMRAKDRLRCNEVDAAFRAGGLALQARSARALQTIPLTQQGDVTILGPDFEVQQLRLMGDPSIQIAVQKDLDSMISANLGIWRARPEPAQGNPRTAEEVRLNMQMSTILTNSAILRFYSQLDRLYQEMWRRAESEVARNLGIPKFPTAPRVKAQRATGQGSLFMRQSALQSIAPIASTLTPEGQQNWKRDLVASYVGPEFVDRYVGPQPTPEQQYESWIINQENNDLAQGQPSPITGRQDPIMHLEGHMAAVGQIINSLQEGGDPDKILVALDGFGPHIAQHLQTLSKQAAQPYVEAWKQLSQVREQMAAMQQERLQQQQQAQQLTFDQQLQTQKQQHDQALSQAKADQQMEIRKAKAEQDLAIQAQKGAG